MGARVRPNALKAKFSKAYQMVDVSGLSVGASVGLVIGSAANSSIKENRVSGVIYAYEPAFNLLLMKSKGAHNGVANWRFIPIQSIQQILSSEMTSEDMSLPEMNEEIAARREERAFQWVSYCVQSAMRTSLG